MHKTASLAIYKQKGFARLDTEHRPASYNDRICGHLETACMSSLCKILFSAFLLVSHHGILTVESIIHVAHTFPHR